MNVIIISCKWLIGWPQSPCVSKRGVWSCYPAAGPRLEHCSPQILLLEKLCAFHKFIVQSADEKNSVTNCASANSIPFCASSQHRTRRRTKDPDCHWQQQEMSWHMGNYCGVGWEYYRYITDPSSHQGDNAYPSHSQESYFQSLYVDPIIFPGHTLRIH